MLEMTATISISAILILIGVGILIGAAGMGALVVGRRIVRAILEGER